MARRSGDAKTIVPADLDFAFNAWRRSDSKQKPGWSDMANMLAVLFNDILTREYGLVWINSFDPVDRYDFALFHEALGIIWNPIYLAIDVTGEGATEMFKSIFEAIGDAIEAYRNEASEDSPRD